MKRLTIQPRPHPEMTSTVYEVQLNGQPVMTFPRYDTAAIEVAAFNGLTADRGYKVSPAFVAAVGLAEHA